MKQVIAICSSSMRSGKSTVADVLVGSYGFKRIKFAGVLKQMLLPFFQALGIQNPWNYIEGDARTTPLPIISTEENPITARRLMQTLGTEWGRMSVSENVWVDITRANTMRTLQREQGPGVVIDDMRFINEYKDVMKGYADNVHVTTVRVIRPGFERDTTHASEGELDNVQMMVDIINNGTLEELEEKAKTLLL